MKVTHSNLAIRKSNRRKQRKQTKQLSDYWLRKSVHIRLLPKTYKEIRKFAIDEAVTLQGVMEFFLCKLLDKDDVAEKILDDYKLALKREGSYVSSSDIEDIVEAIEANSPLNDWSNTGIENDDDNDDDSNDKDNL